MYVCPSEDIRVLTRGRCPERVGVVTFEVEVED